MPSAAPSRAAPTDAAEARRLPPRSRAGAAATRCAPATADLRPARRPARSPTGLVFQDLLALGEAARSVVVRVRQSLRDQPDGANRVVVAGDRRSRSAPDRSWCRRSRHRDAELVGLVDGDVLAASDRPRTARPGARPCRGCRRGCFSSCSCSRSSRRRSFFDSIAVLVVELALDLLEPLDRRLADRREVGERAAEPARASPSTGRSACASSRIDVLRLALGADEEDAPVARARAAVTNLVASSNCSIVFCRSMM